MEAIREQVDATRPQCELASIRPSSLNALTKHNCRLHFKLWPYFIHFSLHFVRLVGTCKLQVAAALARESIETDEGSWWSRIFEQSAWIGLLEGDDFLPDKSPPIVHCAILVLETLVVETRGCGLVARICILGQIGMGERLLGRGPEI